MNKISRLLIAAVSIVASTATSFAQIPASKVLEVRPEKTETTADIMERAKNYPVRLIDRGEREYPSRKNLPQNPLAPAVSSYPAPQGLNPPVSNNAAQTPSTSFNGATGPDDTNAFPPDNQGAVGPTQFIVFVNGRLRSFNKTTGVADGVLNADPDVFFASVMTPVGGGVTQVFTSDPRIRYDRISARWLLLIIDVPCANATCTSTAANRCLLAVSNSSTITAGTIWTFTQFTGQATAFLDYPTLGMDINGIYIGGNMFTLAGAFQGTNGYVINRANVMSGAAYTVYSFNNLAAGTGAGPFTPQGVNNFDLNATEGYFIGVDNAAFSLLQIRRVSTPAGVPTISANISLTVPTTTSPNPVTHSGNTGGNNGRLDALDDRLYAAMMRNGRLWTAHNFRVSTTGVANTAAAARNATRWYEIQNLTGTPSLVQSGTVFDNAATLAAAAQYWIPSVMVSGQGHAAISMSAAGTPYFINAATVGRLSGDALGTTSGAPVLVTASSTAYNPPSDPGGASGRRWGDYSFVSLDPLDDMTMWQINQYCVATNKYGCNVTKLLAPPPATPASTNPISTPAGQASVNVIVTGTSVNGSGFYDPGANLAPPALPFNHITASVSGGVVVNSVTYTDPTHVTLNLNTVGVPTGLKNVTITNPDGQSLTGNNILDITAGPLPVTLLDLQGKLNNNLTVLLNWATATESNNKGFYVERSETGAANTWSDIGFVAGAGSSSTRKNYSLTDAGIQLSKIYYYRLRQVDLDGNISYSNEIVVKVKDLQKDKLMMTSYPNPFKGLSTIKYNLPSGGGQVSLKVYDITGKEVSSLADGFQQSGLYTKEFNATRLSPGIYFCKLVFEGETIINRIMLIR